MFAEMPSTPPWRFDHVQLFAGAESPLDRLFIEVMSLREGARPPFPFPGQWLYAGNQAVMHVIADRHAGKAVRFGHIAFRTELAAEAVVERLNRAGFVHDVSIVPASGDAQLFVSLPGGLVVELDAPVRSRSA